MSCSSSHQHQSSNHISQKVLARKHILRPCTHLTSRIRGVHDTPEFSSRVKNNTHDGTYDEENTSQRSVSPNRQAFRGSAALQPRSARKSPAYIRANQRLCGRRRRKAPSPAACAHSHLNSVNKKSETQPPFSLASTATEGQWRPPGQ